MTLIMMNLEPKYREPVYRDELLQEVLPYLIVEGDQAPARYRDLN